MPTRPTNVRLERDVIAAARRALDLPDDAPIAHVIRTALRRVTGDLHATGAAANRGGRPPKTPR